VSGVPAGRSSTHFVVSDVADAEFGTANVIVPRPLVKIFDPDRSQRIKNELNLQKNELLMNFE
jgi:hypothetical protein